MNKFEKTEQFILGLTANNNLSIKLIIQLINSELVECNKENNYGGDYAESLKTTKELLEWFIQEWINQRKGNLPKK